MREVKIDLNDGRYAVLRNFLKNRDRSRFQREMLAGKEYSASEFKANMEIKLVGDALVRAMELQAEILLMDYNGERENPFEALMDSEFEEDYNTILSKAGEIFGKSTQNLEK